MNGTEGHGKNGIALFLVETLQTIAAALEEGIVVFCIFKDALAVDAAHHDMINSCPRLDTAFPWHNTILFGTLTCPLCP